MSWCNDELVIDMTMHKCDQTGERVTPKHLYANPYQPEVCSILALVLHVFSICFRPDQDEKSKVFLGDPYEVFTKWLSTALATIPNLGYNCSDFGTHSFRKGIATYA
jgi:hypothetical protein